jgi:hypothetical protein
MIKLQIYFVRQHSILPSPVPPALLLDDSAGGLARELWWTNQFSTVDILPPWFSMLMYHQGDEQLARWWPQFRDVVQPHRHDRHQGINCTENT